LIIKTDKEEAKRIEYPISLISIAPTILDLTGIKYRLAPFQGQSLFNSVKMKNSKNNEILLYGTLYGDEKYGVIKSGKKLIVNTFNPLNKLKFFGLSSNEPYELYNLLDDPKELNNLWAREEDKNKEMLLFSLSIMKNTKGKKIRKNLTEEQQKELKRKLRALGYIR